MPSFNNSDMRKSLSSGSLACPMGGSFHHEDGRRGTHAVAQRRPLTAFCLFLHLEKERILTGTDGTEVSAEDVLRISQAHRNKKKQRRTIRPRYPVAGGCAESINFVDLARTIADRWKSLPPSTRMIFEDRAKSDLMEYKQNLNLV